jgi:dTMP kinase
MPPTPPELPKTLGLFVVLEGIDGSGTTTQVSAVARALRAAGHRVHVTGEPSKGPLGTLLRQMLSGRVTLAQAHRAELMSLLFAADRLDHLGSEVEPLLSQGFVVLSDRYDLSSLAYQSATSSEGEGAVPWIRELNRAARRPELTFVLQVSADVAAARRQERGGPEELFEQAELQARLASIYAASERLVPGDRLVYIDGSRAADEVTAAILASLNPYLSR